MKRSYVNVNITVILIHPSWSRKGKNIGEQTKSLMFFLWLLEAEIEGYHITVHILVFMF